MSDRSQVAGEDVLTVPRGETREDRPPHEDGRPELRAETLSMAMRVSLLVMTLLGGALTLVTIVTAFAWPEGVFRLGGLGAAVVGSVLALVLLLQLVFGALLENNDEIERPSRIVWIMAFVLTGPFGILLYWFVHVWRAPRKQRHPSEPVADAE
jgi:hypothetical protein